MILDEIRNELFKMQDTAYRDFNSKLIPTVDKSLFIGVRTPELRKYAKQLAKREDIEEFLHSLPHKYFDDILEQLKGMYFSKSLSKQDQLSHLNLQNRLFHKYKERPSYCPLL